MLANVHELGVTVTVSPLTGVTVPVQLAVVFPSYVLLLHDSVAVKLFAVIFPAFSLVAVIFDNV